MIYVIQMVELRSAAKLDQFTPEIGLKGLVLCPVRVPETPEGQKLGRCERRSAVTHDLRGKEGAAWAGSWQWPEDSA
jgi:hypothetical protein